MNKYKLAIKQIISEIKIFVNKEYRLLLEIWLFINGLLGVVLVNNEKQKMVWVITITVQFILLLSSCKFIKTVKEIQKPIKRFTKKTKDGNIFVEENRLPQALIYLSILEDQLEEQ